MPPHQPQEDSWNEIFHSDGGGDSSDDEKVNCPGKEVSFPTPLFLSGVSWRYLVRHLACGSPADILSGSSTPSMDELR